MGRMIQFVFSDNISKDDENYFTGVYLRYEALMYATARKYMHNVDTVEDIVQDSVEKLIKKTDTLKTLNSCTLAAYIVYTVRNTAINHLRRADLENSYFISEYNDELEPRMLGRELNPESIYLDTEFSNETWEALRKLPEKYMILLKGKYLLGLNDRELAKIIGCSPSSVRMYLTRARRCAVELLTKGELTYE